MTGWTIGERSSELDGVNSGVDGVSGELKLVIIGGLTSSSSSSFSTWESISDSEPISDSASEPTSDSTSDPTSDSTSDPTSDPTSDSTSGWSSGGVTKGPDNSSNVLFKELSWFINVETPIVSTMVSYNLTPFK